MKKWNYIGGLFFVVMITLSLGACATVQPAKPGNPKYAWVNGEWPGVSDGGNLTLDATLQVVNDNELRGEFDFYYHRSGGNESATITSGRVTSKYGTDRLEFTITYYPGKTRDYLLVRQENGWLVGTVTSPSGSSYGVTLTKR